MTILDELALVKPEIPVTSIRTVEYCCHLKIKTRIVLNGMKIKEFYVLCVDICD